MLKLGIILLCVLASLFVLVAPQAVAMVRTNQGFACPFQFVSSVIQYFTLILLIYCKPQKIQFKDTMMPILLCISFINLTCLKNSAVLFQGKHLEKNDTIFRRVKSARDFARNKAPVSLLVSFGAYAVFQLEGNLVPCQRTKLRDRIFTPNVFVKQDFHLLIYLLF